MNIGKVSSSQLETSARSPVKMAIPVMISRIPMVSSILRICFLKRARNFMKGFTAKAAMRNGMPRPAA